MRVYLVDDEKDLVWATLKRASRQRKDITFEGFLDGAEALKRIRVQPPEVLVTDLRMPNLNGLDLLIAARELVPGLPVVLITAYGSPAVRQEVTRRGSVVYMEKPFAIDELLESIDLLFQQRTTGFSGSMAQLSFVDLVQIQALARFSGALQVSGVGETARLFFADGEILHAECGELEGAEVVNAVISWVGGSFELLPDLAAQKRTIGESWQTLLLEACRVFDENKPAGADLEAGADDAESAILPIGDMGLDTGDFAPAEPRVDAPGVDTTAQKHLIGPTEAAQQEETRMSNVKESLQQLEELDGFMGACVVDSNSGMMLGSYGGGLDLEVAAAGNTEVVRAKTKTMKALGLKEKIVDILITLGTQYHLIRPIQSREGLFTYCVLNKSKANLAMSRIQLAAVEESLVI